MPALFSFVFHIYYLNGSEKELVIARLEATPQNKKLAIGSHGDYTIKELITLVEKDDPVGKEFVEMEMDFMKAFKEGKIYDELLPDN